MPSLTTVTLPGAFNNKNDVSTNCNSGSEELMTRQYRRAIQLLFEHMHCIRVLGFRCSSEHGINHDWQ